MVGESTSAGHRAQPRPPELDQQCGCVGRVDFHQAAGMGNSSTTTARLLPVIFPIFACDNKTQLPKKLGFQRNAEVSGV